MSGNCFQSLDLDQAASALARLHQQVAEQHGRIEITRMGSDQRCVLISKCELDSLEQALQILSTTDSAAAMHGELLRVASEVSGAAQVLVSR